VAETLEVELRAPADWLNLESIAVERDGKFARHLAAAIR
jgi:uncharacterized protein YcaQ